MANVLIRDVPDSILTTIDVKARRLGLSRNEYLRREMLRVGTTHKPVTVDDIRRWGEIFADLADPEIMDGAWH